MLWRVCTYQIRSTTVQSVLMEPIYGGPAANQNRFQAIGLHQANRLPTTDSNVAQENLGDFLFQANCKGLKERVLLSWPSQSNLTSSSGRRPPPPHHPPCPLVVRRAPRMSHLVLRCYHGCLPERVPKTLYTWCGPGYATSKLS